jgi:hypothetical protein
MSKKLIAVSAAFALALTGLVGIAPANANAATIVYSDNVSATAANGTTAATAFLANVPQSNALVNAVGATGTTLKIVVSNLVVGDTATVSATGPGKVTTDLIAASKLVNVTTLGAASVTTTVSSGVTATFYVYTTSTSVISTISISITETDGTTKSTTSATRYLEGESLVTDGATGNHYKVTNVVVPTTLASGSAETEITFNTTDAFGNVLETPSIVKALTASTGTLTGGGNATWDAVRKLHVAKVTSTTNNPFVLTIDINGSDNVAPNDLGLGASSTTFAAVVNNAGVAAQITALTAQLAALQIIKDRKVSKLKYNRLARKWNAAFPSQKVWVKP